MALKKMYDTPYGIKADNAHHVIREIHYPGPNGDDTVLIIVKVWFDKDAFSSNKVSLDRLEFVAPMDKFVALGMDGFKASYEWLKTLEFYQGAEEA